MGTVQIVFATPPNQPHRADIAKLLVSQSARGQGVGARLMEYAEQVSLAAGKTLLVLDTATGGAGERLYACAHGMEQGGSDSELCAVSRWGLVRHHAFLENLC